MIMRTTEDEARKVVKRNGGHIAHKTVSHSRPGLKVLSAIDCLVNYYGYKLK